jgi:hemerythrin superfamily protein
MTDMTDTGTTDTTDVTELIERDHRAVDALFAKYDAANLAVDRRQIVDEIRLALVPHAAAEEILVYPAVRRAAAAGDAHADHAIDEHQEIKELLAQLDDISGDESPERAADRDALVARLRRAVEHHVEEEETRVLPRLRLGSDQDDLDRMGTLFEQMKPLLPTHPHPAVPGTATAQLLAGPLASVADRIRDFVGR